MSLRRSGAVLCATAALSFAVAAPAGATPANVPSAATAETELGELTVHTEGTMTGYSRDLFPTWDTISGSCDTRETVIERDGSNVGVDSSCKATSGSWTSPYDDFTTTSASAMDIDHIVPLAEAWRSGAAAWTTARREQFANELHWPQLMAVSASSNRSKGDQDPTTWLPEASYQCRYARMWVRVKFEYQLTLQSAEKTKLQNLLDAC